MNLKELTKEAPSTDRNPTDRNPFEEELLREREWSNMLREFWRLSEDLERVFTRLNETLEKHRMGRRVSV